MSHSLGSERANERHNYGCENCRHAIIFKLPILPVFASSMLKVRKTEAHYETCCFFSFLFKSAEIAADRGGGRGGGAN